MANVDFRRCFSGNCGTRATFGDPITGVREYCRKHAPPGMLNVERKKCAHVGCLMPPAFWHPNKRHRRCCVEHAEQGMVKLDKKLCPFEGCFTSASYGVVGEKRKYCAAHAQKGMVSIGGRRCATRGCIKRANYGVVGTNKREFCAGHAEPRMVNINIKHGGRSLFSSVARCTGADSSSTNITNIYPKRNIYKISSPEFAMALTGGSPIAVAVASKDGMRPGFVGGGELVHHAGGSGGGGGPFSCCGVQGCTGIPASFPNEKGVRFCEKHAVLETVKQEGRLKLQQQHIHHVRHLAQESTLISSGTPPTSEESFHHYNFVGDGGTAPYAHEPSETRRPGNKTAGVSTNDILAGGKQAANTPPPRRGRGRRNLDLPSSAARAGERLDGEGRHGEAGPVGCSQRRVMLPWPATKSAPLLLTASGWTKYDWQPVVMDIPP